MSKRIVSIKNWSFEKNEKAKLIWIGEPFKSNNKWVFYAYFKGDKFTKKVELDWASVHFLSVGMEYRDGDLNNGEPDLDSEIIDIDLSGVNVEYMEKDWNLYGQGFKDNTKSKTFSFRMDGILYTIPIIEVVRAVISPDKFMLNRVVEMDTLENYFTCNFEKNVLNIYFTSNYNKKLLKDEKINHLAWILTNANLFRMFNSIGANLWSINELKFNFLFDDFSINARVEKKDKYIRILQILSLKRKKIRADEINVFHPSLEKTKESSESKLRKYVNKSDRSDTELLSGVDGSTKDSEEISTFLINHEYEKTPCINRVNKGRSLTRLKEDENTKLYFFEDDNLRTTADSGGEKLVRGLEFTNLANISNESIGELNEFVQILKRLEKRAGILSIDIIINDLPIGRKGRRFAKLSDGITNRRYAIGKINMASGERKCLFEVERDDHALSMLLLGAYSSIDWISVFSTIIIGLVDNCGTWDSETINNLKKHGIFSKRIKHKRTGNIYDKSDHIYKKLYL